MNITTRPVYQILVTAKICDGHAVEIKRRIAPVCNEYELETFIDDLQLVFGDCILNTHIQRLESSLN